MIICVCVCVVVVGTTNSVLAFFGVKLMGGEI